MSRAASKPSSAAFVLHSHDWSESSLILDLFTRDHGRVVAVAKGAKRPYSQLRPVLMPFQRLLVTFGVKRADDAEVWLLRQAEWAGGSAWRGADALLPGFYINELLMRLLARQDPHPALFDAYGQTLQAMAQPNLLQASLRTFELLMLRQLGHLPELSRLSVDGQLLQAGRNYEVHPEWGVALARTGGDAVALDGSVLLELEAALTCEPVNIGPIMTACLPALGELKVALRTLLQYHLGSQTLRTRQLMMELHQA